MMKVACIAKKTVGRKKRNSFVDTIETGCGENGIDVEIFWTDYHNHAITLVRDLDMTRYDCIAACGGDGTNYQVLNGLLKYHDWTSLPSLCIIPIGRGNSFARDLNIFSIEDGLKALVSQKTKQVDVCSFTQGEKTFYFVNLMGFGFITDVAAIASSFNWMGDFSYVLGVIIETVRLHFHQMHLTLDGRTIKAENCFVEFCNSSFTGGTMLMAPDAEIDDGFFDVIICSHLSRLSLLKTFPLIFQGDHIANPAIRVIKGQHAIVSCSPQKKLLPDGELFGTTPVEIGIEPRLVRYCL